MENLLAARSQMALSLAFHIVFAAAGIAMPLLMVLAEGLWLRRRDPVYLDLAKRWARGTAILFAVGAVSGTVLSFELGLLWPRFMEFAGPILGMPFSLEGFAFFVEAIFLGIYLYGWDRVPPLVHWGAGVLVLVSGTLSGLFVVAANAWMNAPTGFGDGWIDPWAAMFNAAAPLQCLHMTIAAFQAVSIGVAAIHAWHLRRNASHPFHRRAFGLALPVALVTSIAQPVSGDLLAKMVAERQPAKFAAFEAHWETSRYAPLRIGGWPDEEAQVTRWALEIPGALSFLAKGDVNAEVRGLRSFPKEDRPPVAIVHFAFQLMVACGGVMLAASLTGAWLWWRGRLFDARRYLFFMTLCGPLGFIAIETGWVVTEVGRQPWIIQGVMRTRDAVTPMPGLIVPFLLFTFVYLGLAFAVIVLLRRQVFSAPEADHAAA